MLRCYLALGGNTGPVEETFDRAMEQLHTVPQVTVLRISRVYRTPPVGERAGGEFLNAAAEIDANLPPLELLDRLHSVETRCGRTRKRRWGPRTLDLDVILYGDRIINLPRLRVPHPACWYRRFVLDPLVDIAADVVHPEKGVTFATLRARLLNRPFRVFLAGTDQPTRTNLIETLQPQFPDVEFRHWETGDLPAETEPTFVVWLGTASDPRLATSEFLSLPPLPRLDVSAAGDDHATFLRHVLHSAMVDRDSTVS